MIIIRHIFVILMKINDFDGSSGIPCNGLQLVVLLLYLLIIIVCKFCLN